jgi:beta-glucosidase
VPVFYGHKVSGGRSHWKGDYVDSSSAPLHPFGHGLSYTTFALSAAELSPTALTWHDTVATRVTLTNTGDRAGDEVVQLYVRDPVASVTRPVLELKGFARVTLEPGQSARLTFATPIGQLGFYDRDLAYVVEPGRIDVLVGTSSVDLVEVGQITVVADPGADGGRPPTKAYDGTVEVAVPAVKH